MTKAIGLAAGLVLGVATMGCGAEDVSGDPTRPPPRRESAYIGPTAPSSVPIPDVKDAIEATGETQAIPLPP